MSNLPLENARWRSTGAWPGGTITALATCGPTCLAGTLAGLFRSVDTGRTWSRSGLIFEPIHALVVSQVDARLAYAGTQSGRLLVSVDAGSTWRKVESWRYGAIQTLVLAKPIEQSTTIFAGTADGMYRSLDGGQTWQEANFGLLDTDMLCLACLPDDSGTEMIWVGTARGGLYRSRNAARSWRESGQGLADAAVLCVKLSPHFADDQTAFIGLEGQGLFRSTDGGIQWETLGFEDQDVNAICVLSSAASRRYQIIVGTSEGVFASLDEGADWRPFVTDGASLIPMPTALAIAADGVVLIGTVDEGVLRAEHRLDKWQLAFSGGISAHVPPLLARLASGEIFTLDNAGQLARTSDARSIWETCAFDPLHPVDDSPKLFATVAAHAGSTVFVVCAGTLHRWNEHQHAFQPHVKIEMAQDDEITALFVDGEETIWAGLRAGGIQMLKPGEMHWTQLPTLSAPGIVGALHHVPQHMLLALVIRPTSSQAYCAELWRIAPQTTGPWEMLLALDNLPQPFACLAVSDFFVCVAGHNMLALSQYLGSNWVEAERQPPRLIELDANTHITAVSALPGTPSNETTWCVATNHGICLIQHEAQSWELMDYPVVGLFQAEDALGAVTLGGEIWQRANTP